MTTDQELLEHHTRRAAEHPDREGDEHACGRVIGDREAGRVWVVPLMFTAAIIIGPPDTPHYKDRWCYGSIAAALHAADQWLPSLDLEPAGWHRHPQTGRRRDDTREWVEP